MHVSLGFMATLGDKWLLTIKPWLPRIIYFVTNNSHTQAHFPILHVRDSLGTRPFLTTIKDWDAGLLTWGRGSWDRPECTCRTFGTEPFETLHGESKNTSILNTSQRRVSPSPGHPSAEQEHTNTLSTSGEPISGVVMVMGCHALSTQPADGENNSLMCTFTNPHRMIARALVAN